jgi:hypothetical protein
LLVGYVIKLNKERKEGENMSELQRLYLEAFRLAYTGYSYKELRSLHSNFNSQIDANAIYDARKLLKTILQTHNYPKRLNPSILLRKQDFRIDDGKVSIIYKPKERLTAKIFPTSRQLDLIS